jgi:hypothetical protein
MNTTSTSLALLASLVTSSFVTACTTSEPDDELGAETAADGEAGKGDSAALFTFYTVVPDLRQCSLDAGADCGTGFFASRVNRSATPCGPGVADTQCKVREIDWSGTGMPASEIEAYAKELGEGTQFVLRGAVVPSTTGTGVTLAVTEIWTPSSSEWVDSRQGVFTMVKGNGLACIESPCADKTEQRLNSNVAGVNIAWLDFEPSGASPAWIDDVVDAIDDTGAIVVGYRIYGEGAKGRSVNQFYIRAWQPLP